MATSWQLASFQKHQTPGIHSDIGNNQYGTTFNPHPPPTSMVRSNTNVTAPRRLGNMAPYGTQPDKYANMKSSEVAQIVDVTQQPGPKEKFSTFMSKYGSGRLTPITSQYERFMAQEELSKPNRRPPEAPINSPDPEAMFGLNSSPFIREKSLPVSGLTHEDRSRSIVNSAQTIRSTASDPTFSNNATRGYTLYSDTVSEASAPATTNPSLDRSYSNINSRTAAKHGITYHAPTATTPNFGGGSAMPGLYRSQTFNGGGLYNKSFSANPNAASSWKQADFKPAGMASEGMSPTSMNSSVSHSDKQRSSTETFQSDVSDKEAARELDQMDELSRPMYWLYGSRGKNPPSPYYKPGPYMYHFDEDNASVHSGSQYSAASVPTYNRLREAPSLREDRKPYGPMRSNTFDHVTLTSVEGSPSSSPRLRPLGGIANGKMDNTYDINMMNAEIKSGDLVPDYLHSNVANGTSLDKTGLPMSDTRGKKSILKKSSSYAKKRAQFGLFSDAEIPRFSGTTFEEKIIPNLRFTQGMLSGKDISQSNKKVTFKLTPRTVEISPREQRRSPSDLLRTFNLSFDSRVYSEM